MDQLSRPRIVCAANQHPVTGQIAIGVRHFCPLMRDNIARFHAPSQEYSDDWRRSVQGFIDQHGKFYTREEAWVIADENQQIIRDPDWQAGRLHSEHLY